MGEVAFEYDMAAGSWVEVVRALNPTRLAEQRLIIPGMNGAELSAQHQAVWDSSPNNANEKVGVPNSRVWSEALNKVLYVDGQGEVVGAWDQETGTLYHALLAGKTLFTNEGRSPLVFNPKYPPGRDPQVVAGQVGDYFLAELCARTNGVELGHALETALVKAEGVGLLTNGCTARLRAERYTFKDPELAGFSYNFPVQALIIDRTTPLEVRLVAEWMEGMRVSAGVSRGEVRYSGSLIRQDGEGRVVVYVAGRYDGRYDGGYGGRDTWYQSLMGWGLHVQLTRTKNLDDTVIGGNVFNGADLKAVKPLIVFGQ
jgi:hypothetical protein